MKVSELGEFGLIEVVANLISQRQEPPTDSPIKLLIGIGDDAAVFSAKGEVQLASSDCFVEDIHFTLDTASWFEVGYRALAAALSDIAAMGGKASYALVSLAVPQETEVKAITDLYKGMIELAQNYSVVLAGGDMSRAYSFMINVTIIGSATGGEKQILTRRAAKPNQKVAVTGWLGGAAAGLEMLQRKLSFNVETRQVLRKAFFRPVPRLTEGHLILKYGAEAAIDISDGLLADLKHILTASRVSARLEVERIPVHPAVKASFPDQALEMALSGGEDYELLFTASEEAITKIKAEATCPVTVIGEITTGIAGDLSLVNTKGEPYTPHQAGWDHFAQR